MILDRTTSNSGTRGSRSSWAGRLRSTVTKTQGKHSSSSTRILGQRLVWAGTQSAPEKHGLVKNVGRTLNQWLLATGDSRTCEQYIVSGPSAVCPGRSERKDFPGRCSPRRPSPDIHASFNPLSLPVGLLLPTAWSNDNLARHLTRFGDRRPFAGPGLSLIPVTGTPRLCNTSRIASPRVLARPGWNRPRDRGKKRTRR